MSYERCEHGMWPSECALCPLNKQEENRLETETTFVTPRTRRVAGEENGEESEKARRTAEKDTARDAIVRSHTTGRRNSNQKRTLRTPTNGRTRNKISPLPLPVKRICSACGLPKTDLHRNRRTGEVICYNCYRKDISMHEECSRCGNIRQVAMRNASGGAICNNCYRKDPSTHKECSRCGNIRQVIARNESGGAICKDCYRHQRLAKMVAHPA